MPDTPLYGGGGERAEEHEEGFAGQRSRLVRLLREFDERSSQVPLLLGEIRDGIRRRLHVEKDVPRRDRLERELKSFHRADGERESVESCCASVRDFEEWRRLRRDSYTTTCRWVTDDAWERWVREQRPPAPFRRTGEPVDEHLGYCELCWLARRLAEGRCRAVDGEMLLGDAVVDAWVRRVAAEALFGWKAFSALPDSIGGLADLVAQPTGVELDVTGPPTPVNSHLRLMARVRAPSRVDRIELTVTAEFLPSTEGAEPGRAAVAFPNEDWRSPEVPIRGARTEIPLLVDRPAAAGSFVVRYGSRVLPLGEHRRFRKLTPSLADLGPGGEPRLGWEERRRGSGGSVAIDADARTVEWDPGA